MFLSCFESAPIYNQILIIECERIYNISFIIGGVQIGENEETLVI